MDNFKKEIVNYAKNDGIDLIGFAEEVCAELKKEQISVITGCLVKTGSKMSF